MARNSYAPGDWFGVVRSGTVVVLGPGTGRELVDSLWALLERGPEIHEVLNEVTEGFGVSLTRIPAFGIVEAKDALRVVLRGDLDLDTADGAINGRDVTTWTERRMELPASYRLRIGAAEGAGTDTAAGVSLPLQEGVVLLSGLEAVLAPGAPILPAAVVSADAVPSAVPSAVPEPVMAEPATASAPVAVETILAFEPEPEPVAEPVAAPGPVAATGSAEPGSTEQDHDQVLAEQEDLELTIAPGHLHDEPGDGDAAGPRTDNPATESVPTEGTAAPEESGADDPSAAEVGVDTGATTDEVVRTLEQTSSYDHLWERTVIRNIEDAAVRVDPDAEDHEEPAPATPAPILPEPSLQEPSRSEQETRSDLPGSQPQTPEAHPEPQQPPAVPQSGGLISSVPWLTGNSARPAAPVQPVVPVQPPAPVQWSPPAGPAVAQANGAPAGDGGGDGDHDGHTVMKSSLANLPSAPVPAPAPASSAGAELLPDGTKRPLVLARVCPQGHANPPTYALCPSCGSALSGDGVQVPRPSLGKVRLSSGEVIELDRSLIIGRQPSVSRVQGGGMPALVQVESPGGDISRSHVEVRLEGWHVMLCDLKATNGTVLVREGQAPRRLAQNEMAIVLDGDIAELGENISLRFEEIL